MATHAVLSQRRSKRPARGQNRAAVLAAACACVFVSFASIVVYTFGVFLKPLASAFHWTRGEVSLAFTLAALTVALCSPLLGRLLDRFPARRVVIPCTLVYGAAFGSLAFLTPHLWHLYAVFVLLGLIGNGTTQLGYARVVSAWFDQQRGRALAAVMAGTGFGSMVFPPIAEALIVNYGWRVAYGALGALILVVAVPLAALFLYEPEEMALSEKTQPKISVRKSVCSSQFVAIAAALLLFSFATNGLNTHWAALLSDGGASAAEISLVLAVAGFSALAAKLGTGWLLDRFRAGRVTSILLTCCAGGFVLILAGYSAELAVASAVLVGIGMGAESDAVPYLLTRYFGLREFSELYGYTWFVYAIGGAAGPMVMGAVFDKTGTYGAVLAPALAMVLAAAAIFTLLPSYRTMAQLAAGRH